MKVSQMLQPQWLSYISCTVIFIIVFVDYASSLQQAKPQLQQDQEQEQHKKQLQHAEVNYTESDLLKNGAEIVVSPVATLNNSDNDYNNNYSTTVGSMLEKLPKQQQQQQLQQREIPVVIQTIDSSKIPTPPRVARRLNASNNPPTQQVVQQYDLPVVKKNRTTNKSAGNTSSANAANEPRQRSANSRSNSRDNRKSAVPTTTVQRSNYLNSNTQNTPQPTTTTTNRAHITNENKARWEKTRRGDERRIKATSQTTSAPPPTIAVDSRRIVNKSQKVAVSATVKSKPKSIVTTTTTPMLTTVRSPDFFNFVQNNPFNFFSPDLWALSNPPKPESAKKPPKKYTPTPIVTTNTPVKERKSVNKKIKVTTTTTITTTTTRAKPTTVKPKNTKKIISSTTQAPKKVTTEGPFRIALPTFNLFGGGEPQRSNEPNTEKDKRNTVQNLRSQYDCPRENEVRFQLFPKICKTDEDCAVWKRDELCCEIFGAKSCVSGINKPLEETSHSPILGLIPRKCPTHPLAELWWQVQECETDTDCWPRVCCPDGNKRYCRTSQPELETVPVPVKRSFNYLTEYLECTPPPPPIFDLHPKTCASTLDCFPNVCCQEAGLRHCRPPKKSLLTWMANILNVDFVKRLAQNIVIKRVARPIVLEENRKHTYIKIPGKKVYD